MSQIRTGRTGESGRGVPGRPAARVVLFLVLLALMTALMLPAVASAATSGPNYGTGTSVNTSGAVNWTNPGNIGSSAAVATCTSIPSNGGTSYLLFAKGLGFAIPTNATINGIQVEIRRQSSGMTSPFLRDNVVQLTKNGTVLIGSNLAVTGTDWPTASLQTATYGGGASLWGTTWTPAEINSSNFGVALQARNANTTVGRTRDATVDYIRVTVTYTEATALTMTGVTAISRPYNGTTSATLDFQAAALVGVVGSDVVSFGYSGATGTFDTKAVGTAKPVTVSGITLTGPDAAKYTLTQPTTTADITAIDITVTATGVDKPYDATTDATVTLATDALAGDDVTADYTSAAFDTKDVGIGKPVDVSGVSISGADSGNYNTPSDTATTTADITAIDLTVAGAVADGKTYDGTTVATVDFTGASLVGVLAPDDVTLDTAAYSAAFGTKDVGTAKAVTVAGVALKGVDSGNYIVSQPTGLTAAIDAKALIVAATGLNKVYDGSTAANCTYVANTVTGDVVTIAGTAAFADKNVGTAKPIAVSAITIGGADAGNYDLKNTTASTTGDITAKALTITAKDQSKYFGIQFVFTGTEFTASGLISDDAVTTVVLASSGAQSTAVPGAYPIVARSATGTGLDNYAISYVDGKLTVSGGNTVASFAKPLSSKSKRSFTAGAKVKVAFKVKDAQGKYVSNVKPSLKLKRGNKVVLNVKTVKYNKTKKMYVYTIKTKASWKAAKYKVSVSLGAGNTGRSVTFKLIK
jgi:hypothetical protein